jgi:succinoglycan biosynthesis protein ExoM
VSPAAGPTLSLVVCTYNRPDHLALTLRSCLEQRNSLGLTLELVVIDNHPSGNGRPVCQALSRESGRPIRYLQDLTRNMSVLRNRGFAEASGAWMAFIDDDEVADPDWTDALIGALTATGADIVVGPRLARFEDGAPPAYDPTGSQFVRDLKLPDLAVIDLTTPSGKPRYGLGTGNSVFRMARCYVPGEGPMRDAFGDAGGEDAELFVRLHREGAKIVWATGAIVTETVPHNRTTPAYRLIRTRREAQHYVTIYLDASPRPKMTWLILMLKGLVQLVAGYIVVLATGEFGSGDRIQGRLLIAHGIGKISWRRPVGYIDETSDSS